MSVQAFQQLRDSIVSLNKRVALLEAEATDLRRQLQQRQTLTLPNKEQKPK